jgi:hypothetical protein
LISATGNLCLSAGSTITVQATSQDLTLSQVTAGGMVNIAAQGSILASSASTTITTPGDLILKVVTGTAGSYPSIIAVFTPSGHFAGSSDSLSFTVDPALLTITADNAIKTYGQATTFAPTAFTETGLVSGDSIASVSQSSDGAPMSATVGTYNIVPFAAAGTGLANHRITYVDGTLTVNPAPVTITATPSPTSVTLQATAPTLTDSATIAGGYDETGTITFALYDNGGSSPVDAETVTVSGNGTYSTPKGYTLPTIGTVTGSYTWTDSFSGDTNNNAASGNTGATAQTVVSKASPTLTATATTTNPTFGATTAVIGIGTGFDASGTLSGGHYETGTITFTLYGPTNAVVDTETETVTPSGNGTYNTPSPFVPTVPGAYQWVVSFAGDGNNNSNSNSTSKGNTPETAVGPGATIVGSALDLVGGTTNDRVNVQQSGTSNTGSTGIVISGQLDGANLNPPVAHPYNPAPATIYIVLFDGNDQVRMEPTLTIPAAVSDGNGNDQIQLGQGNNVVMAGNGNDHVQAGDGNSTVTVGSGCDHVQAGDGNNVVTANTLAGHVQINLGNGNNVIVEGNGNGNDQVSAGNGDNLIVGGTGHHDLKVGNGRKILIDGSVSIANRIAALDQVLSEWIDYGNSSANVAAIRSQLGVVTYNATNANKLQAGSGLDWFWYTRGKDQTNRKSTDLLN